MKKIEFILLFMACYMAFQTFTMENAILPQNKVFACNEETYINLEEQLNSTLPKDNAPLIEEVSPVNKNRWNITLTEEEKTLLAKIVWIEARGESDLGEIGVIEVIFNRMVHEEFGGDLLSVISAKNQFCSWKIIDSAKETMREYELIECVLSGETELFNFQVVYFSTRPRNNLGLINIGNHYFCEYEK